MDNIKLTLGDKIRVIRRARGLTQEQLANKIGIQRIQISWYETGKIHPSINTLEWICKALNIKASDLLGF